MNTRLTQDWKVSVFFIFFFWLACFSAQSENRNFQSISTQLHAPKPPKIQKGIVYHQVNNISQYYVSEKLDGVRGYWDGHQLWTRQGHIINAPHWFTAKWPSTPMDGELWMGRQSFEKMAALLQQTNASPEQWRKVKFMIFDLPKNGGTFKARVALMKQLTAQTQSPFLSMIKQQKLESVDSVFSLLDSLTKQGAEGLMLHDESAYYTAGRTSHLMKLKKYQDAEAIVLGHVPGQGKFRGLMGSIRVKTPDGKVFNIGSGFTKKQRQSPPKIGTIITYKYFGKTAKGTPRFASFLRIRTDV